MSQILELKKKKVVEQNKNATEGPSLSLAPVSAKSSNDMLVRGQKERGRDVGVVRRPS